MRHPKRARHHHRGGRGHGGVDPGASGRRGTREKDVVLEVAKALMARINQEPGMKAVLTRDGDYFISLQERTLRARRAKADLFVSIHADAIANPEVSGSSVYVLSDRGATSEAARWLAERENAADLKGGIKLDDKDPVLRGVLLDLADANISFKLVATDNVLRRWTASAVRRRPAGGIRGAEFARCSLDAGQDRLHLESRRRAKTFPAGTPRQAGQRDLLGN
jgi:N-acetylmuramoyl-L-alanine amidase